MWYYLLLLNFLSSKSFQSEILDLMTITDRYFKEFQVAEDPEVGAEVVKSLLKRNYNLNEDVEGDHEIYKRSVFDDHELVNDSKGVYLVSDIRDVITIPAKFPNDINILSSHNLLYITALESNGSNPELEFASFLVLYQYSFIQGIKEMGRVPVLGGSRIGMYSYQNVTYLISAEHGVTNITESFQGSTLYKMIEWNGKIYLEKVQILNVVQPNDVRFWEHQDQLFLSIGTNMGNDTHGTGVFIYRWSGFHFDCLQTIQSKTVKSITPFAIGSFMYLAIANSMNELGNTDVDSEIYKFYLDDMKFRSFQKIKTHRAQGFSYFNFNDGRTRESEHFLAVANSAEDYVTESIIYKYDGHIFVPFQSFNLPGAIQWLPIKGPDDQFLLLVAHSNGVVGYQYNGWRFSEISLNFHQSPFGENINSMRSFQYFGETFLTISDKNSPGNSNNMWKISFSKNNELEKHYHEVRIWCESMNSKLAEDNFSETVEYFEPLLQDNFNRSRLEVTVGDLKGEDLDEDVRDELERLSEEVKRLEEALEKLEDNLDILISVTDSPIFIGSKEIPHLEVKCGTEYCCTFKNLEILKVNGEDFTEFLENVVSLDEDLENGALDFKHVVVEDDVSPLRVNGNPSQTLIDVSSDTFINAELVVRGTVFVNGDLKVNGLFEGTRVDRDLLLLSRDFQKFEDELKVNSLKVKNFKVSGLLNGIPIDSLMNEPEMYLENNYKELNVNNIVVEGLVNENNMSEVFSDALRKSGNQEIEGDLELDSIEAEEIIIGSNQISNLSVPEYLRLMKERLCEFEPYLFSKEANPKAEYLALRSDKGDEIDAGANRLSEFSDDYVIIVEGLLKAKDISDERNSSSIVDVVANSRRLNESIIDSIFTFSDITVNDLIVEEVNDVPVSSWLLKNSTQVQHVHGMKVFADNVHIENEVSLDRINGIDLKELEKDVLTLDGDQVIADDFKFETIKCHKIKTTSLNLENKPVVKVNHLEVNGPLIVKDFRAKNLTLAGKLNNISWADLVEDCVFSENDVIIGEKTLEGRIQIENLNVSERINRIPLDEFVAMSGKESEIVVGGDVKLNGFLNVDKLDFEGLMDDTLKPNFKHEWLLQGETQIVTAPVTFDNLEMKMGSSLMNETINNTNLRKLFKRSVKVNEDAKIKHLYVMGDAKAQRLDVGGMLNGADFSDSVVRSRSNSSQDLWSQWFFSQGFKVNGSLVVEGHVSGLNMSHVCGENDSNKISLIVGGTVSLRQEPEVTSTVNGIELSKVSKEVWMKNENVTLKGRGVKLGNVIFDNKTVVSGYVNSVNLSDVSRYYLSKTQNRVISSDFEFEDLVIRKWCRMHGARVGGKVNGIDLTHLTNSVLLQDREQVIEGKLRFEIFQTSEMKVEGNVNSLNLSSDVLRLDRSDAVVEGEKTFQGASVVDLLLAPGKTLQEVDVDVLREELVRNTGDIVLRGDLILNDGEFNGAFKVSGKVNDIDFNSENLLTTTDNNKVVTGTKRFQLDDYPNETLRMHSLELSSLIAGLDLEELIRDQAYSHGNFVFAQPQTFTGGLAAHSFELDGLFQQVNVSQLCENVFNPVNVNDGKERYKDLLSQTKTLIEIAENAAFYFDYFELIQTLKPNVRAVVPTLGTEGNYLLAVFTSQVMTFMEWNTYSESFVNIDEGLRLKDNVSFVTSEITKNGALLYIENARSANIFQSNSVVELEMRETSCVASFDLKPLNKSCIFVGQKRNTSRILCDSSLMGNLQTFQVLDTRGSVQATTMDIEDEIYIAVINKEEVFDKTENTLTIYRFDPKLQHFYLTHTLAEVNPVALSSISYKNDRYLVSAGGHLPESVHNSVLSIFRFNKHHKVFVRAQSIQVDTPVDVHFALLPSSQLALYVLTSNPTKPFVVFLHKGISGFVEETSGPSLYPGSKLYSFTDLEDQHFVMISGYGRGQILKAGFKGGNKTT